jgi:ammonium transporter, Amt family
MTSLRCSKAAIWSALLGLCLTVCSAATVLAITPELRSAREAAAGGPATSSLSLGWILAGAFLVMFMQAGFGMLDTGFTRSKNAVNTIAMTMTIYPIALGGFWLIGYGLMMGGVEHWPVLGGASIMGRELAVSFAGRTYGLAGASKFALIGAAQDSASPALFLLGAVFASVAATIPVGAMAERWKFSAFVIYGFFMSMVLYPLYGNWVWGGGWLSQLGSNLGLGHGYVDVAGSSVVHMTGGVTALAGAIVLGPRIGKFRRDGAVGLLPGHNLPMAVIGTLVLAFGWFGLTTAPALAASDPRAGTIAVNTMLSSAAGALTAMFYLWHRYYKPDIASACNGLLGGLVAISAPCAFLTPAAAVLIGVVAGFLAVAGALAVERRLRIDDPVGAISVHGLCGLWGALAVGIFADNTYGEGWNGVSGGVRGLLYGDASQFAAQLIGAAANLVVVFAIALGFFIVVGRTLGNRVPPEVEWTGLDRLEMGGEAYPNV